ncbi:hypothetical protein EON66_07365, partial [archaeon]
MRRAAARAGVAPDELAARTSECTNFEDMYALLALTFAVWNAMHKRPEGFGLPQSAVGAALECRGSRGGRVPLPGAVLP